MKRKSWLLISFILIFQTVLFSQSANTAERPKVGLVLSGGGAKGFAYIGLLKALQKAGLEVDYIGGTSIGSIMGGLYALGYSPDAIEKMIREQNWDDLLVDRIDRKYVTFDEKEFGEKAIVALPFKARKITLSASLHKGQEIDLLLNRYFSPAYEEEDFHKLFTPFICMGTDLITGQPVILDKGNLARAIRASMSIPGYFPPVEYEGMLLVDGGVVNNFPVKNVKKMGAEYIIGGDVQPGLKDNPEELNSITTILEQMITFGREEANKEAMQLTDLYIPLDNPYSILAFSDYDSLIAFGDRVANNYFPQIKKLADSLNAIEYKPLRDYKTHPLDSVNIHDIYFDGFKHLPLQYFIRNWKDIANQRVSLDDIESKIRLMYGTHFFEHVYYEFDPDGEGVNMTVHVVESDPGELSAAIHYDNNYQGSILLNMSLRNLLGKRSKLFSDLVLGPNPRFRALYLIDNGKKIGFGAMLDFYNFQFDLFEKATKVNKIDFTNFKGSVFAHSVLNNLYRFRAGFEYEYFRFKQDIMADSILELFNQFSGYGTFFASFDADTRDNPRFPNRGFLSNLRIEYVMPIDDEFVSQLFDNSFIAYLRYEQNISLSQRWVLRPGIFAGGTLPNDVNAPLQHTFAFGGLNPNNYINSFVSFAGIKFFQKIGHYAVKGKMQLQYNFAKKLYGTALVDVGANTAYFDELFEPPNWLAGYGLSLGYDSFIGPIQLTVMGSNINKGPLLFLNLGYWF